jgi:hypothetical protein
MVVCFSEQIRQEFGWVPKLILKMKRSEILKRFLARTRIYATDFFAAKYEQQARRNLERSILRLKSRGGRPEVISFGMAAEAPASDRLSRARSYSFPSRNFSTNAIVA